MTRPARETDTRRPPMGDADVLDALEHIERMEAFVRHARTLTDDPEAQCVARMIAGVAASSRKRLRHRQRSATHVALAG